VENSPVSYFIACFIQPSKTLVFLILPPQESIKLSQASFYQLSDIPETEEDQFNIILLADVDSIYFTHSSFRNLFSMMGEDWAFAFRSLKDRFCDGMHGTRIALDCSEMSNPSKPMVGGYQANVFRLDRLPSIRICECYIPGLPGYKGVVFCSFYHCHHLRSLGLLNKTETVLINIALNMAVSRARERGIFPRVFGMFPKFRTKGTITAVMRNWINSNQTIPHEAMADLTRLTDEALLDMSNWEYEELLRYLESELNGIRLPKPVNNETRSDIVEKHIGTRKEILEAWNSMKLGLLWTFSLAGVKNHYKTDSLYSRTVDTAELVGTAGDRLIQGFLTDQSVKLKESLMKDIFKKYRRFDDDNTLDLDRDQNKVLLTTRDEMGVYHFDIGLDILPSSSLIDLFLCSAKLVPKFSKAMKEKREAVSAYMAGAETISRANLSANPGDDIIGDDEEAGNRVRVTTIARRIAETARQENNSDVSSSSDESDEEEDEEYQPPNMVSRSKHISSHHENGLFSTTVENSRFTTCERNE
jgi:hypothetical protein